MPDGALPRRDSRRAEILDAFTRAVAERGYDGTNFGDLAAELVHDRALAVVRAPGSTATEEDILAFAAAHAAPYKRVRRLEFIEAVPKSASGKILRRELRQREKEPA